MHANGEWDVSIIVTEQSLGQTHMVLVDIADMSVQVDATWGLFLLLPWPQQML